MTHDAGLPRIAGALLAALAIAVSAPAAADDDRALISVTGEGHATAVPDAASVRAGVDARAETAEEALRRNTEAMTRVIEALEAAGIERRAIQTSGLSVRPVMERPRDRSDAGDAEIDYFQVVNEVTVRTEDLEGLGTLLDALVSSGANRINGISFEVTDRAEALAAARRAAVGDARTAAETFARAAGARLGEVVTISDRPPEHGGRPEMAIGRVAAMADAAPVPVERGEQRITARVFVVWELEED